jgi:hypothetical protein
MRIGRLGIDDHAVPRKLNVPIHSDRNEDHGTWPEQKCPEVYLQPQSCPPSQNVGLLRVIAKEMDLPVVGQNVAL